MANIRVAAGSLSVTTPQTYSLSGFKGVDYASTLLNVEPFRASQMKNFIHRDGSNHKRNGWEQILRIENNDGSFARKDINGFWQFKDYNGNEQVVIHAGTKLYKATLTGNRFDNTYTELTIPSGCTITNERSFGVIRGNRLYIFCGSYLVYGSWDNLTTYELRRVYNNVDTFIPTTTIQIRDTEEIDTRTTFQNVNLLSKWRKNKLISCDKNYITDLSFDFTWGTEYTEDTQTLIFDSTLTFPKSYLNVSWSEEEIANKKKLLFYYEPTDSTENQVLFYLIRTSALTSDGSAIVYTIQAYSKDTTTGVEKWGTNLTSITVYTDADFNGEFSFYAKTIDLPRGKFVKIYTGSVVEVAFKKATKLFKKDATINVPQYYYLDTTEIDYEPITVDIETPITKKNIVGIETTSILKISARAISDNLVAQNFCYELGIESGDILGKINRETGILILNRGYDTVEDGVSNVTVTFAKTTEGSAEKIEKCKFGIMFGYNEVENLFVSGNPDYPNYDFYSTEVDTDENLDVHQNLTYFGDLSSFAVGDATTKIVGYSLLEDNTLAVHKEKSYNSSSLYLRMSSLVQDSNGNIKVQYSQFSSTIAEGGLNFWANANLAGDKLLLSKNGVYGLTLASNIKTNERIARERSRFVNPQLLKETNLEEAVAIAYDNRYYLAINNKVYIADARFQTQYDTEMDDTFSYEWWLWDNTPVRIWCIVNGNLAFGTAEGDICVFNNSKSFVDISYDRINSLTISNSQDIYYPLETYAIDDNTTITIHDNVDTYLYSLVANVRVDAESLLENNGCIKIHSQDMFYNNVVYLGDSEVYLDSFSNTLEENAQYIGKPFRLYIMDYDERLILLQDWYGNTIKFNIGENGILSFRISRRIVGEFPIKKFSVDDETAYFKIYNENKQEFLTFVSYNNDTSYSLYGHICYHKPIEVSWFTNVINFGTSDYSKNLKSITIVPEAIGESEINVGWLTRKDSNTFYTRFLTDTYKTEGTDVFDLFNMNFNYFSVDPNLFARSYTKILNVKNFNFIQLYFTNKSEKDCVVNSVVLNYTINKRNKGVR